MTAWMGSVTGGLGFEQAVTAGLLGGLIASLVSWLGSWVSHTNARLAASVAVGEKAATPDNREIRLEADAAGRRVLRFKVVNRGTTPAHDVTVTAGGVVLAYAAVVAAGDIPEFTVVPEAGFGHTVVRLRVAHRDFRGSRKRHDRVLVFEGGMGVPRWLPGGRLRPRRRWNQMPSGRRRVQRREMRDR